MNEGLKTVSGDFAHSISNEQLPVVSEFQTLIREGLQGDPKGIDFKIILGSVDPSEQRISETCIDSVLDMVGNYRFYADSDTAAHEMRAEMQNVTITRTTRAEMSAHQVFFATLDGVSGTRDVAVKPLMEKPDRRPTVVDSSKSAQRKVVTEWVNTLLAHEYGLRTFRPVGIIPTESGGFLLTERRDNVESLDNTGDWRMARSNEEANQGILEDLTESARVLAQAHDAGVFHGDAQLRNFVVEEDGQVYLIDWESSSFLRRPDWSSIDFDHEANLSNSTFKDLESLFDSLARPRFHDGVGFIAGLLPPVQLSYFKRLVLEPYIEERLRLVDLRTSGDEAAIEPALAHLGAIEERVETYIRNGEQALKPKRSFK